MTKKEVEERLKDIPEHKLKAAQESLDDYCDLLGMKPWKINAGRADWRELCFRILGLPSARKEAPDRGRRGHDREFELQVLNSLADHTFLSLKPGHYLKGNELNETVAKELKIKPRLKSEESGKASNKADSNQRYTNPAEVVRGIDNRISKRGLKKASKKSIKE
jgi:hypothetical protein